MAYYTGEIKNPYQDPIRKETELSEKKPLSEAMKKRIAYFNSTQSKKINYDDYLENCYGKPPPLPTNQDDDEDDDSENREAYRIYDDNIKDNSYDKVRKELIKENRKDTELSYITNYIPPKKLYYNQFELQRYIDSYQAVKKVKSRIINGITVNKEYYNIGRRRTQQGEQLLQKVDNLRQRRNSSVKARSTCYPKMNSTPDKRKNAKWDNFRRRQFQYEFKKMSGVSYNSIAVTPCEEYSTQELPLVRRPTYTPAANNSPPKYKGNKAILMKERSLSKLLAKGVCKDGYLKKKYLQYLKTVPIQPIRNSDLFPQQRKITMP